MEMEEITLLTLQSRESLEEGESLVNAYLSTFLTRINANFAAIKSKILEIHDYMVQINPTQYYFFEELQKVLDKWNTTMTAEITAVAESHQTYDMNHLIEVSRYCKQEINAWRYSKSATSYPARFSKFKEEIIEVLTTELDTVDTLLTYYKSLMDAKVDESSNLIERKISDWAEFSEDECEEKINEYAVELIRIYTELLEADVDQRAYWTTKYTTIVQNFTQLFLVDMVQLYKTEIGKLKNYYGTALASKMLDFAQLIQSLSTEYEYKLADTMEKYDRTLRQFWTNVYQDIVTLADTYDKSIYDTGIVFNTNIQTELEFFEEQTIPAENFADVAFTALSEDIITDATHRFVSGTEKDLYNTTKMFVQNGRLYNKDKDNVLTDISTLVKQVLYTQYGISHLENDGPDQTRSGSVKGVPFLSPPSYSIFQNVTFINQVNNTGLYTDYPYVGVYTNTTQDWTKYVPTITFTIEQILSGNYSNFTMADDNKIYVWTKQAANFTVLTVKLMKTYKSGGF